MTVVKIKIEIEKQVRMRGRGEGEGTKKDVMNKQHLKTRGDKKKRK